ncbi:hypothetical protein CYMTET_43745 [Cymbomonas tetramitiformis]|uniref:Uncharacterized protein n=1 Tax=Cymbomonas tetramitiformis TaxID=36881 RepID=A0AAE0EZZ9_9CHLO|nr:hypothetical protein CYMTET_43745 [Cymbomonas tetramitiformis]
MELRSDLLREDDGSVTRLLNGGNFLGQLCIIKHAPEPTPTNGALFSVAYVSPPSKEAYSSCLITISNGPRQRPLSGDAGKNLEPRHGVEPQ